jgi:import inner membrane translocase subunit TIM22
MTSFEYSTPQALALDEKPIPLRQQLRTALSDTGKRSLSMAKNFAVVGAIYASTECVIEGYRARHDIVNSVSAGCVTGGLLGVKSGPQAAFVGCIGFAAFSAAMDTFLESR